MKRYLRNIALAALVMFSSGSALAQFYGRGEPRVEVFAAEGSNQSTTAMVHIVAVFDRTVLPYLPKNAPEWFGTTRAHVQVLGHRISVAEYEVHSNSGLLELPLPRGSGRAVALMAYVNYVDPAGQAVVRLPARGCSRLIFEERRVVYTACA